MKRVSRSIRSAPVLVLVLATALGGDGCGNPTQITVVVTTDVPCNRFGGATISVGDAATSATATTTTAGASDGTIGTIVVVPGGERDSSVFVRVVAGVDRQAESCEGALPALGCITAKRSLSFIPRTPLTLPIAMRASCNGVVCPADETCVRGVCRTAAIADPGVCTSPDGCGEEALPPTKAARACTEGARDCFGEVPRFCRDGNWLSEPACQAPMSTCIGGGCTATASISGQYSTACLTLGRKAWCWGDNSNGLLGNGTSTPSAVPVLVKTSRIYVQVAVADRFACGRATDGVIECWGGKPSDCGGTANTYGACTFPWTPTVLNGVTNAVYLSAGNNHLCAVVANGDVYCWGSNSAGESSGDGKTTAVPFTAPARIPNLGPASAASSQGGTCVLLRSGRVTCWGDASSGVLGNGDSVTPRTRPDTEVIGVTEAVEIAGTCVRLRNGDVYCWGRGPVGDGSTADSAVPAKVSLPVPATALGGLKFAGTFVLTEGGVPYWWNGNESFGAINLRPVVYPGITDAVTSHARADTQWFLLRDGTVRSAGGVRGVNAGNGINFSVYTAP